MTAPVAATPATAAPPARAPWQAAPGCAASPASAPRSGSAGAPPWWSTPGPAGAGAFYPAVAARLHAAGFDLLSSFPAGRPGRLGASLAAAIDLQPDLLIVGGGDGSISEAARRLAYRDMALGIVPLGTTNNFARTLGIPLTLAGGVSVLTKGKVADVDLGRAGDAIFANLVSAGLSAHVAATVPHHLKRLLGRAAYPGHRAGRAAPGTGRSAPSPPETGATPWTLTSSTSPTAASTPGGRSPAMPVPTTGCCRSTASAAPGAWNCSARRSVTPSWEPAAP